MRKKNYFNDMEMNLDFLQNDYMVFICCMTYNHSNYIKASLEGFAHQETVFPFVCVVMDDCSTDGEQAIIQQWIDDECDQSTLQFFDLELSRLYVATHKINKNCRFVFYLFKLNLCGDPRKRNLIELWRKHTKYEAICEGDDYWTYSKKLQEQIDFLESHSNYSATSSNAWVLRSDPSVMTPFGMLENKNYSRIEEIVVKRQFHTASVVFRTSSMQECPYSKKGGWDTFLWCCLLTQGPIHYDAKVTCVYRKDYNGITQTTPKIEWLTMTTRWADTLTECFVPEYVQRKYIVRSVTKDIIVAYFNVKHLNRDDKAKLLSLYLHNFEVKNFLNDLKIVTRQIGKKILKR